MNNHIPEVLYHYTSPDGVLGIAHSKCIWATNIHYLNDSKEFKHALELFSSEILRRKHNNKDNAAYYDELLNQIETIESIKTFVASFSAEGDLLSQWRAYCPPGGGYSIGFETNKLLENSKSQGYRLRPCIYNVMEQRTQLQKILDFIDERYNNNWKDNQEFASSFLQRVVDIAPTFKHPGFSEEKEWRLSLFPDFHTVKNTKHRAGKKLLIPYQEFDLRNTDGSMNIKKSIVGPSDTPGLSLDSLTDVFSTNNISWGQASMTTTPLRGW